MPVHRESAGPRIIKAVPIVALVVLLFTDFRLNSAMGQVKGPALVFRPALERIQAALPSGGHLSIEGHRGRKEEWFGND
jgi:hypothetical protein